MSDLLFTVKAVCISLCSEVECELASFYSVSNFVITVQSVSRSGSHSLSQCFDIWIANTEEGYVLNRHSPTPAFNYIKKKRI